MGIELFDERRATAASTLDWWREAGVDVLVDDLPRDWLAAPAKVEAVIAPAVAEPTLPATLAEFLAWRAGDAAPEAGWRGATITASGPADAAVMILSDCPDREDEADCALFGGAPGRLLDRMLAAIGLIRDEVHVAAVCVRRPLAGRMPSEIEARLGEIARHHVALVAPKRLLLLGNAASRAVLDADTARMRGGLRQFNHEGGETGVVASFHPRMLIERPAQKAEAWKDLQVLIVGMDR